MTGSIQSITVGPDHVVPIEPTPSQSARVTVASTGSTVFYADNPYVTATSNQGSIPLGSSTTFTSNVWLFAAKYTAASVLYSDTSPPAASPGWFIGPSGDTTGAQDTLAINAALVTQRTVQLHGSYFINAPLVIPSNTTLLLTDATVFLANGSNCNMVVNSDPLNASGGNTNISIIGSGVALFDANSAGQTYSSANTAPAQSYKGHTIILSHVTSYVVSNIQLQHITYYGISPQQATDGYISNIEARLAGPLTSAIIQTMGAITRLAIDGVRGQSEDDSIAFSTGDLYSAYYIDQTLVGPLAGNVSDISVRNVDIYHNTVFPRCHLICMFTGSGCTMQRISLDHINQRYPTQNQGQIGIGVSNYFISAPSTAQAGPNDLADIKITNTNARFVFSGTCANVKISGVQIPAATPVLDIPAFLFTGGQSGLSYKDMSISDVVYNGPATVNPLFQFTNISGPLYAAGSCTVASMKIANIRTNGNVPALIGNVGAAISNLEVRNVNAASFSQGIIQPGGSGSISGFMDGVNVNTSITTAKYGTAAYNLAYGPNMPVMTAIDPAPATIDRSIVNADSSLVLDGGTAVSASYQYQANAPTYNLPVSVAHTAAAFTSASSGVTTGAITTTGATLMVVSLSWASNFVPVLTDSKSNTWIPLNILSTSAGTPLKQQLFYCIGGTVGAGHTFTLAGTNIFGVIGVTAYSGVGPTFMAQNGAVSTSTTVINTGPLGTGVNTLAVTGLTSNQATADAVDSGFTILDQINGTANHASLGVAHLIQTAAATVNPQWSAAFSTLTEAASIATFNFLTAGAGGAWKRL